jgi:hypothetical protein
MISVVLRIIGAIVFAAVLTLIFNTIFRKHNRHKKHHYNYRYIAPISHGHRSGWIRSRHVSHWVKVRLFYAPEYEPEQGIHYYPYCKGRHYEYLLDDQRKIFKRKLHHKKL